MPNTIESQRITTVGKSWVIRLPKSFTQSNKLEPGTQVLLTVKKNAGVEAEILPPLSTELSTVAGGILKNRRAVYEELKRIGD